MYERYCILRDSLNLRDIDVAKATGLSPTVFSDWKSGKSKPNTDKLIKITKVIGCSVEYLVTGEEHFLNNETAKISQIIIERPKLKEIFDMFVDLSDEEAVTVIPILQALSNRANNK